MMPIYVWPIPAALQDRLSNDTPSAVTEFLASHGITVNAVTVNADPWRFEIDAATDPVPTLSTYTGQPSARRDRLEKAQTYLDAFTDKVTASQVLTVADVAKAVAALAVIVRQRTAGMDT
jgi:hypothetical protein